MEHDNNMGALQAMLQSQLHLVARGFTFEIESPTVLVVCRGPHVRGLWRKHNLSYTWTPPGYLQPIHVAGSAEAALRYTLTALA